MAKTKEMILTSDEERVINYIRDNIVPESGYECHCFGKDKELGVVTFYNRHSAKGRSMALSNPIYGCQICYSAAGESDANDS